VKPQQDSAEPMAHDYHLPRPLTFCRKRIFVLSPLAVVQAYQKQPTAAPVMLAMVAAS
jgi:hypothetical protein